MAQQKAIARIIDEKTTFEYSYLQRVVITRGFYKGYKGTVIDFLEEEIEYEDKQTRTKLSLLISIDKTDKVITLSQHEIKKLSFLQSLIEMVLGKKK